MKTHVAGRLSRLLLGTCLAMLVNGVAWGADASVVKLVQHEGKWQLLRNGKPYFIKGGGGGGPKDVLAQCGGNSFRTWGIDASTLSELDEAEKLGLTVSLGYWLGHKEQGFHYDDPVAVKRQFDAVQKAVERYKDHPALLIWSLGNEMEIQDDSPAVWQAIEELAKMVHRVDPRHPTMTVIAELGKDKVQKIRQFCPDIDIIGLNTYGGGPSLAARYRQAGGKKPYIVTEFGPPGTWEISMNAFGAAPELTSSEKAECYKATYVKSVLGAPDLCLGSYAFTWGYKIEATSTWFGLFLPDGSRLAGVDVLEELWSGRPPAMPCPAIKSLAIQGKQQVSRGEKVCARVTAGSQGGPVKIEWVLCPEQANYGDQGSGGAATPSFPEAIRANGGPEVVVTMPKAGGIYRLYCYLRNAHGGAAVGSLPIKVLGPVAPQKPLVANLPLVIYGDGQKGMPYNPSGWMGNTKAIQMEVDCTENPHAGAHCLKFTYADNDNWAGVVWQHPANDWGEKPGGYDLTGAEKLVFWARGGDGGEKITFGYGVLGNDKKYHDSSKGEILVTLTKEWKEYSIDLNERDLGRIKSGFMWSLAGQGKPLTFYLDGIQYK
ncbi:MAG: glycoside hydrolase family 2 TIM barrel-domain containing protein [Thermoguttaceae bacterium]|jgi:hypothetical protein